MRFINSLKLLVCNFKNSYKILLYRLIVILLAFALSMVAVMPSLHIILNSSEFAEVVTKLKEFFKALINFDGAYISSFQTSFAQSLEKVGTLLNNNIGTIVGSIIGLVVVYLATRFLDSLCTYAISNIVNDHMSIYGKTSFASAYIKNLGKASVYSIVYVLIEFVYTALTIAIASAAYALLNELLSFIIALFVCVTLIMLITAFKFTWMGQWLPSMVVDKLSMRKAMSRKARPGVKNGTKIFLTYLISVYVVFVINIVAAFVTVGSSLLITLPATTVFFICEQFVNYYTVTGRKYFVTYEDVTINPSFGMKDNFFTAFEEETTKTEENTKQQEETPVKD